MGRAIILAAGRGERMRPVSDTVPKALLEVGGRALIEWQVVRLVQCGFTELVINHAWLGEAIETRLGDGSHLGASIQYSRESEALETAGGIARALPLLGAAPFVAVSADIYTDFDYRRLRAPLAQIAAHYPAHGAHLVLTDNPPYHPAGDMALAQDSIGLAGAKLTYANIAVFHPGLFESIAAGQKTKLFPWLYDFLAHMRISGEHFRGTWENIGTPQQLALLQERLGSSGTGRSRAE